MTILYHSSKLQLIFLFFCFVFFFRRKVREAISKTFPDIPKETLSLLIPNKDEMSVMKLFTHSEKNITCYCLRKNPIFFDIEGHLIPTGIETI